MDDEHASKAQRPRRYAIIMSIQQALDEAKSCSHDVIGVVVKISVDAVNSKAHVLIADTSIPENSYARVALAGSDCVTPLLAEVSAGDVIMFHGFRVTKHDSSKLSLVADFFSSWQEPDAGWNILYRHGEQNVSCEDRATTEGVRDLVEWSLSRKLVDSVSALPCRRRRLSELHTVGMKSHVVARVVSVDTATAARAKRKFHSTIAVLMDGSEVMPFLDCAAHEATLKTAINSGNEVLLTNVVTCAAEERSDRGIVLRPTDSTSVVPMLNTGTGPPQVSSRETQCLSLTQDAPGMATCATQTLSSPLRAVFIDDLNISLCNEQSFVSPHGFASAIIDQTGSTACFREATLTLDRMVVKASAEMMQILCGSMDPESILNNTRLRGHVTDLIRGLIEEEVMLTWNLERNGDVHHATKCVIPRL